MPAKPKPTANSSIDSVLKYLLAALAIFIPLYPKFPVFSIPGVSVAVRAEDFIIALIAVVLLSYLPKHAKSLLKNPLVRAILIYWAVTLLSVISAAYVTRTAPLSIGLLHWARRIEYMIPLFAALLLSRHQDNLRFFYHLIFPVALGVFLYAVGQIFFGLPVISTQNEEFSKGIALTLQPGVNISSTFAGHYDLATYLVMVICLILPLLFTRSRLIARISLLVLASGLFWLLMQTGSRISFFAFLACSSFLLLLLRKPLLIPVLLIIAVFGMANTPRLAGRFVDVVKIFQVDTIKDKVQGVFDTRGFLPHYSVHAQTPAISVTSTPTLTPTASPTPTPTPTLRALQQDRSTSIRLDVEWPRALRAFIKNPFLGTGFASITLATDNDYLRALGETGALGFLSLASIVLIVLSSLVWCLLHLRGLPLHFAFGWFGAVLGFLIIATFIDVFEASKTATFFWLYTGFVIGLKHYHHQSVQK